MKKPARGIHITTECEHCKGSFNARLADIRRGWGRYCTKTCKAQAQAARQRAEAEASNNDNKETNTP